MFIYNKLSKTVLLWDGRRPSSFVLIKNDETLLFLFRRFKLEAYFKSWLRNSHQQRSLLVARCLVGQTMQR